MPQLRHSLPKYSVHRASGQARIKFQGKHVYLGPAGSKESHERYARFIASLTDAGTITPPADQIPAPLPGQEVKLKEVCLRFHEHAKRYYRHPDGRETGEATTIRCCLQPAKTHFGEYLAVDFGPLALKELMRILVREGRSRVGINRTVNIIRRAIKWAVSEQMIPPSVHQALMSVDGLRRGRTPARECEPIRAVSDDDIAKTLAECNSPMVHAMIRLGRATGMRPGEMVTMTRQAIETSDPECWEYRPGRHKTSHHGKGRVVMLNAQAIEILRPWILRAGDERVFPIAVAGYRRTVNRAAERAGVPSWSPNAIRHRFATEARSKFGLDVAQVLLGHSNADVTQVYAETDLARARAAAKAIG
jgi:integrase